MNSLTKLNMITLIKMILSNAIRNIEGTSLEVTDDLPPQHENQKIPKMFHTIWIDFGKGKDVFPKYEQNIKEFHKLHPGWIFKNWTEPEIIELIKFKHPYFLPIFQSYDKPIKKHDSARMIVLDVFGGVYIDHDFIPLKNIESLLKFYEIVLGNEESSYFCPVNGLIATISGHPFLRKIICEMNKPEVAQMNVLKATGPALIKRMILSYAEEYGTRGVKIYSNKFFYPIPHWNKSKLNEYKRQDLKRHFQESYMIQEYDTTWIK